MRLQDWDITASFCNYRKIDAIGETMTRLTDKSACIRITNPHEIASSSINPISDLDWEVTLVHELFHIKETEWCASLTDSKIHELQENIRHHEVFIDHTAQALVAAKRGRIRLK